MGKIIELKDKITGETIYPITQSDLVLDDKGGNVVGYLEKTSSEITNNCDNALGNIEQSLSSIKQLKGKITSDEGEKVLAETITEFYSISQDLDNLHQLDQIITKYLNNSIKDEDVYSDYRAKQLIDNVLRQVSYIPKNKPTKAPKGKELRLDEEGNFYIGIDGVWYLINPETSIISNRRATIMGSMLILEAGTVNLTTLETDDDSISSEDNIIKF